jgi:predicted transcriptional regulator
MVFRRSAAGLASIFGALELRVLEVLWARGGESAVRDIIDQFPGAAYTTLMTTMERLYRKGVLLRRKDGRAFVYRTAAARETLESGVIARTLEPLLHGNATPILSCFVDELGRHDERLLDELERLVRAKREAK